MGLEEGKGVLSEAPTPRTTLFESLFWIHYGYSQDIIDHSIWKWREKQLTTEKMIFIQTFAFAFTKNGKTLNTLHKNARECSRGRSSIREDQTG
jgi:hypothetical protein